MLFKFAGFEVDNEAIEEDGSGSGDAIFEDLKRVRLAHNSASPVVSVGFADE